MHRKPKHSFHLVDPSPWPLLGAFAAGIFAVGFILFMDKKGLVFLFAGIGFILLTMVLWWRDVVHEAQVEEAHTPIVQTGLRYGIVLFILSEVMFFFAFFWAFFNASLFPPASIGGEWPPLGIEPFYAFDLPWLNTLILLTSGTTVTWAHHAIREDNRKGFLQGLGLTILLGITFTCLQIVEYSHAPFGFGGGIYPSTFFMATGFHGFHVIIGTTFLLVCFFRGLAGHFSSKQHIGFEAAAWYWHFVDVVWLFLFVWIYWWGGQ